jgi:hypothetical protein
MRINKKLALVALLFAVVVGFGVYTLLSRHDKTNQSADSKITAISNTAQLSRIRVASQTNVSFMADPTSTTGAQLMQVSGQIFNGNAQKLTVTLLVKVRDQDSGKLLGTFITTVDNVAANTTQDFSFLHVAFENDQNVALTIEVAGAQ